MGDLPELRSFPGLSAKTYEHPADRAATAALAQVPFLDPVVRKLVEFGYERAYRQSLLAGAVKIGPSQLPDVWEIHTAAVQILDLPTEYDVYVTDNPLVNAMAVGSGTPMVVLNSGLVALLAPDELQTVIAHELGHILSDHVLYKTALAILLTLGQTARLPFIAGLPLMAVRSALLEWSRAAELSCDRAATLVTRDPLVTCRTLMVIAGGLPSARLDLDAFLTQSRDREQWGDPFDRLTRLFQQAGLTHAYPVRRCGEIQEWVHAGALNRILDGDYVRKGHEPPLREEANDAVTYYTERFADIVREAGDSVSSVGRQVGDWVRSAGSRGSAGDG